MGERVHATLPLLLGIELVRADVAKTALGLELGDAPCGGPITWALLIDGVVRGRTDEPMTDDDAQRWARRIIGDGARFELAHPAGGYWLTDTTNQPGPEGSQGLRSGEGGWSR
ncbi:hypothetical protein Acsp06_54200 [Actinomycetospora sp. NBRC 106375]|uniref:hypothetical protein n=1 Tax=Actinomycetospora sp. NBRC 106375 TaxID=3032207 RepID=UPI0024A2BC80|nr:hypothetical protein [Actinomycetospora sp. NBRC 106375]GLZ49235.1 hypothetical protein Acsp06_54200 [Actinomycetospora sp. NBRC 106375]